MNTEELRKWYQNCLNKHKSLPVPPGKLPKT